MICSECGDEFDPVPWADANDPICDACIEEELEEAESREGVNPWH